MPCLLMALLATLLSVSGPRVVQFTSGQAFVEQRGASERVVVKDRSGRTLSESECDNESGRYDQIVSFATKVKAAAARRNRGALAALMSFPLRVNTAPGKGYIVPTRAALLAHFGEVFPAAEVSKIARIEPHEVFCRNGMSMLGDGLLWMRTQRNGALRAAVVNTGR